jgi:sugar phosphate isomerase/epimerase
MSSPKANFTGGSLSRRNFLAITGLALPAAALAQGATHSNYGTVMSNSEKKYPIGLELWSVRGELKKDLPTTLRNVSKMGYEAVEFFADYFPWTFPYAKEVRSMMDDLGLRCYSTHNHIEAFTGDTMAKGIELNQIIGAKYIVMASAPNPKGVEGWKKLSGQLSDATEKFKTHGLSGGYHNHDAEWAKLENGQRILEVIAENTPKEFMMQLDVGTCMKAGADPIAWIKANPGRIKSVHLKDWAPGTEADQKAYRVLFGEGVSPWKEIIAAAESVGGVEYYLMEQEGSRYPEFETAQRCLDAWKAMRKA